MNTYNLERSSRRAVLYLALCLFTSSALYAQGLRQFEGEIVAAGSEHAGADYLVIDQNSGDVLAALSDPSGELFGQEGSLSRIFGANTETTTSGNQPIYEVQACQAPFFAFPAGVQARMAGAAASSSEGNLLVSDPDNDNGQDDDPDGDGIPTSYEFDNDLDPGEPDADEDEDKDFMTNGDEYLAGTLANDPGSLLKVESIQRRPNGDFRIRWQSVPGETYRVSGVRHLPGPISNTRLVEADRRNSFTTTDFPPTDFSQTLFIQVR
jgi:hypothetical protein